MELFLLRGTSFLESVADGFVQDCRSLLSLLGIHFSLNYYPNSYQKLRTPPEIRTLHSLFFTCSEKSRIATSHIKFRSVVTKTSVFSW